MNDTITIELRPVWDLPRGNRRPIFKRWHGWVSGGWRNTKHYYGPWRGYTMWRVQLEVNRRKREVVKYRKDLRKSIRSEEIEIDE